jgi:AraC-like DNA-binding protein
VSTTISKNVRQKILARAAVPGITVQVEDSWLDSSPDQGVYTSYSEHVLSLLQVDFRSLRPRTGFLVRGKYVPPCNLLGYDPPEIVRYTYTKEALSGTQLPLRNRAVSCYFEPDLFSKCTGLGGDRSVAHLDACLTLNRPFLVHLMQELFREMTAPGFATDTFIDSVGRLLMTEIARHFKTLTCELEPTTKRLAQRHLDTIHDYLHASYGHIVTLAELARTCGLSADYLRHAFRNSTGQSLGAYVQEIRLTKAKSLLTDDHLTMKQIAHRVGFASPSSFCVAFHKATGETPKAYRSRHWRASFTTPVTQRVMMPQMQAR